MAKTKILGHTLAVVCFGILVSASRDVEDVGRSEAAFDESKHGQTGHGDPNLDMSQREVTFDLADIWGFEEDAEDVMQKEVTFKPPDSLKEKVSRISGPDMGQRDISDDLLAELEFRSTHHLAPSGPALFSPRGAPPSVVFPPGRPTPENIQAICLHGSGRPRYPQESLPLSGFSHLSRQADAVHRTEAWYSQQCCQGDWQQKAERTWCCARQAWEKALNQFCEDEFGIKTRHYHCCKLQKRARWLCFEREAPNPSYQPTTRYLGPEVLPQGPGFTFNNNCPRTQEKETAGIPRALRGESSHVPDITFPPARPTASNIRHVCQLRKHRPRYIPSCLPRGGFGWLARQSKSVNRLERGLKRCCKGKKKVLACADEKWKEEMKRFCRDEHMVKTKHHECCKLHQGQQQFSCFSSKAPDQNYTRALLQREIHPVLPHIRLVCDTHKILKKLQVGVPVDTIVKKCCHLEAEKKSPCLQDTLNELQRESCSAQPPSSMVTPDCCGPNPTECFSDLLMKSIKKAVKSPSFTRRKCPLQNIH